MIRADEAPPFGDSCLHLWTCVFLTGDLLEQCALLTVRTNDIPAFARFYSQLDAFYTFDPSIRSSSALRPRLVSLLLLSHLAQNRIGGFHTVLETLASAEDEVLQSTEVAYTVELEKALMEGSFARIWRKKSEMPSADYAALLDTLMFTVRCVVLLPPPFRFEPGSRFFLMMMTETRLPRAQKRRILSCLFKTLPRSSSLST